MAYYQQFMKLEEQQTETVDQQQADEPKIFNNIGYLFSGYNIYKGNPISKQGDPGIVGQDLFKCSYSENKLTGDQRYKIPDHTIVNRMVECDSGCNSSTISGETSLTESFKLDVSLEVEGYGAAFKASSGYQKASQDFYQNKKVYINTQAKCYVYFASLEQYNLPPLSENVLAGIQTLNDDMKAYHRFIETFGTHYITSFKSGARFGKTQTLSSDAYQKAKQDKINIDVAASGEAWGMKASAETKTAKEKTDEKKFSELVEAVEDYSVGSFPPQGGSVDDWISKVQDDPMPFSYSLRSIDKLLEFHFQDENHQVVKVMRDALQQYCQYLLGKQMIQNCLDPAKDQVFDFNKPIVTEIKICPLQNLIQFKQLLDLNGDEYQDAEDCQRGNGCFYFGKHKDVTEKYCAKKIYIPEYKQDICPFGKITQFKYFACGYFNMSKQECDQRECCYIENSDFNCYKKVPIEIYQYDNQIQDLNVLGSIDFEN